MEKRPSISAFRETALIPSRLNLQDFDALAWFPYTKLESRVREGKSRVQAKAQETTTQPVQRFTVLNLNRAALLRVSGYTGQVFTENSPSLFLMRLYEDDLLVPF